MSDPMTRGAAAMVAVGLAALIIPDAVSRLGAAYVATVAGCTLAFAGVLYLIVRSDIR